MPDTAADIRCCLFDMRYATPLFAGGARRHRCRCCAGARYCCYYAGAASSTPRRRLPAAHFATTSSFFFFFFYEADAPMPDAIMARRCATRLMTSPVRRPPVFTIPDVTPRTDIRRSAVPSPRMTSPPAEDAIVDGFRYDSTRGPLMIIMV